MATQASKRTVSSTSDKLKGQRRRSRWGRFVILVVWSGWLAVLALLAGQHYAAVLHPWSKLLAALLLITTLAALIGILLSLWRLVRGPQRWKGICGVVLCLLPLGSWAGLSAYMLHLQRTAVAPKNVLTNLARVAIASVMELEADYRYPHRMESGRIVMSYDDRVHHPERDLEAMDRHVAGLEAAIGKPLKEKIHWVRGTLLGQSKISVAGLALGSSSSPNNWETADHPYRLSVDRHELAHAVIQQIQPVDADPPLLLVEGWAEFHSGMSSRKRAELALHSRSLWKQRSRAEVQPSYLRELTDEHWYHRVDGPVYNVGGAFAEYVIKTFGIERFLGLYFNCRPGRFEYDCEDQLGVSFDALESGFWDSLSRQVTD